MRSPEFCGSLCGQNYCFDYDKYALVTKNYYCCDKYYSTDNKFCFHASKNSNCDLTLSVCGIIGNCNCTTFYPPNDDLTVIIVPVISFVALFIAVILMIRFRRSFCNCLAACFCCGCCDFFRYCCCYCCMTKCPNCHHPKHKNECGVLMPCPHCGHHHIRFSTCGAGIAKTRKTYKVETKQVPVYVNREKIIEDPQYDVIVEEKITTTYHEGDNISGTIGVGKNITKVLTGVKQIKTTESVFDHYENITDYVKHDEIYYETCNCSIGNECRCNTTCCC